MKSVIRRWTLMVFLAAALPLPAQVLTSLHNFSNTPDGAGPGGVVLSGGTLFSSGSGGGTFGNGLIFSLGTNSGTAITPIRNFAGGPDDGASPNEVMLD